MKAKGLKHISINDVDNIEPMCKIASTTPATVYDIEGGCFSQTDKLYEEIIKHCVSQEIIKELDEWTYVFVDNSSESKLYKYLEI